MELRKALELAKKIASAAHKGQLRRGGDVPYIEHPKAVAKRVGDDLEAQIVAWLHDVIEDSEQTAESLLQAGIPPRCVEAVVVLTKKRGVAYESYLERVSTSRLATKVKIADMLSNLADDPTPRQIRKYAQGLLMLCTES